MPRDRPRSAPENAKTLEIRFPCRIILVPGLLSPTPEQEGISSPASVLFGLLWSMLSVLNMVLVFYKFSKFLNSYGWKMKIDSKNSVMFLTCNFSLTQLPITEVRHTNIYIKNNINIYFT